MILNRSVEYVRPGPDLMTTACVVLAGGRSRRLGRPKELVSIDTDDVDTPADLHAWTGS